MNGPTSSLTAPTTVSDVSFDAVLELSDGTLYSGISFGSEAKSVAGECVFQTGTSVPSLHSYTFLILFSVHRNGRLHRSIDRSFV
jgi:Carbamoyl-phosphate synthase small chain, CPSase domain